MYSEMQAYGSLALEVVDAVLDRCVVLPATVAVPSSLQPKKQTHSLQWVLLGWDLGIFPTREVGGRQFDSRKGQWQKRSWDTSSWFLSHYRVKL